MTDIRAIAAVGKSGQIGLDGVLPWHDAEDLRRFRELTEGGLVVVGRKTFEALPPLGGRQIAVMTRSPERVKRSLDQAIVFNAPAAIVGPMSHMKDCVLWIAGGAKTYRAFAPWVQEWIIRPIDYDGPADTHFPCDVLPGVERMIREA